MDIYESIKKREIILPAEHQGQLGFDYAWKELLARAPAAGEFGSFCSFSSSFFSTNFSLLHVLVGPMLVCDSPLFDRDMFNVVSKQVISSIAYASVSLLSDPFTTGFR